MVTPGKEGSRERDQGLHPEQASQVAERLCAAGAPGVSIIEIHPFGYRYESTPFAPHAATFTDRYRYLTIVSLEIVCPDAQLESPVQIIREQCSSGNSSDGMIFLSEIVDAIKIKDGLRGSSHSMPDGCVRRTSCGIRAHPRSTATMPSTGNRTDHERRHHGPQAAEAT